MTETSILVVDPDESHRRHLKNILNPLGFSIRTTETAPSALSLLDQICPDLVILDESVKGLTPDRLLNELDQRGQDAFTVIVADKPDLERGMGWIISGAFAYLAKPTALSSLRPVIEKGLENKSAFHQVMAMAEDLKSANEALKCEKAALKEKGEQLRFLNELGLQLSATLKCHEIRERVSKALSRMVGADLVLFLTSFSPDEAPCLHSDLRLSPDLAASLAKEMMARLIKLTSGPSPEACLEDSPGSNQPLVRRPKHNMIMPLTAAGRTRGLLGVYFFSPPDIGPDRVMLVESVALQSAQALFNAYQHETALSMAAHDSLTGLFNRRAFDEDLQREFERSRRYGTELSLIMIDLDHFKSVNDRFGHKAGDEVLKTMAGIIRDSVRGTDLTARFGGEEFAVILPNTDQEKAFRLAWRIQENARRTIISLDQAWHRQTLSQGVADTRAYLVKHHEDLINLADQAMYLAKEEGRNTIRAAGDLNMIEPGKDDLYAWKQ